MSYRSDSAAVTHQAVVRSDTGAITDDRPGCEGISVRLEMKARISGGHMLHSAWAFGQTRILCF